MKNYAFTIQVLLQIVLFIMTYEIIHALLVKLEYLSFNLSMGVAIHFLLYVYIILSIVFWFALQLIKESKLVYTVIFIICCIVVSLIDNSIINKMTLIFWFITVISSLLSYFICNRLKSNFRKNDK